MPFKQEKPPLQGSPLSVEAALTLADAGDREAARAILLEITEQNPNDISAWLWLAQLAFSWRGREAYLRRLLNINPTHSLARKALAEMIFTDAIEAINIGDWDQGVLLLKEAAELNPKHEPTWMWLASLTFETDPIQTIEYLQRVLEINPKNEKAQTWREEIYQRVLGTSVPPSLIRQSETEVAPQPNTHDSLAVA